MTEECPRHPGSRNQPACPKCVRENRQRLDPLRAQIAREAAATGIAAAAAAAIAGSMDAVWLLAAPAAMAAGCCAAAWLECEVRNDQGPAWQILAEGAFWRVGTLLVAAGAAIF